MLNEHDRVVLTESIPGSALEAGDVGSVIFVHDGARGFEVEFVSLDGKTSTVVELEAKQVRPVAEREIPHARLLVTSSA